MQNYRNYRRPGTETCTAETEQGVSTWRGARRELLSPPCREEPGTPPRRGFRRGRRPRPDLLLLPWRRGASVAVVVGGFAARVASCCSWLPSFAERETGKKKKKKRAGMEIPASFEGDFILE